MEPTNRIIVNTIAQYLKAVINTVLALYSTRPILDALQVSDYGIYTVVGGVVAMLGFITNALVITTQRYISYYHGHGISEEARSVFANSLVLHVFLGALLMIVLLLPKDWIIHHILNIPSNRIIVAGHIYVITTFMLFFTILYAPFKALFIARENIIYIALVEIADAVIKFILAINLVHINADKLLVYAVLMGVIVVANFLAFSIYASAKFEECTVFISPKEIKKNTMRQLLGFAGWTTYGMGAVAGRNQGTAVVLNHFFGTSVNAAYGIAFQIYGAVAFVVTSLLNAMNPQIMKLEGGKEREKMLSMAGKESKYSVALLAIATLPLIIEMPAILDAWLKEVPPYTSLFCRFVLISFLCDQLTMGLQTAIQATGQIRSYTLLIYTPKLLFVPVIWIMFQYDYSILSMMVLFFLVELFVALIRIPYCKLKINLCISNYVRDVIIPQIPLCSLICIVGIACSTCLNFPIRFVLTYIVSAVTGIFSAWLFILNKGEKHYVKQLFMKRIHAHD